MMIENKNKISFRRKVEKVYYNYGKFAASHPILMLTGVITVILISWYPLPNAFILNPSPYEQRRVKLDDLISLHMNDNKFIGYVQQIVVQNTAQLDELSMNYPIELTYDALSECFSIIKAIKSNSVFMDNCYKTGDIKGNSNSKDSNSKFNKKYSVFPTFSCLILSPIQLWNEDSDRFWSDGNILQTINQREQFVKEMVFGLPWKKTGIRNLLKSDKSYKVNFVITFVLKYYEKRLINKLYSSLKSIYNLSIVDPSDSAEEILYIDCTYLTSHMTLLTTYLILILYVYFSVRKIEMVKSKIGLAFSACFTVAASLYMSLGICIYIGIIVPTLPGSEIFPYLVIIIGLENTLVITKSVVATPVDLPVKHRIAQGLEKEGWAITKNLVSEILIFSLGIFTFNPAIQEFFMLALIGLAVDFFLQITFFVTVLSIDMRRIELSDIEDAYQGRLLTDLNSHVIENDLYKSNGDNVYTQIILWIWTRIIQMKQIILRRPFTNTKSPSKMSTNHEPIVPKGHKRKSSDINIAAFIQSDGLVPVYIPKRLLFLFFLAKSRIFQKLLMITAAFWILVIILYSTHKFDDNSTIVYMNTSNVTSDQLHSHLKSPHQRPSQSTISPQLIVDPDPQLNYEWKLLAIHHWPRLAELYSINITSHKLIILPPWQLERHVKLSRQLSLHQSYHQHHQLFNPALKWFSDTTNDLLQQLPSSLRGWADAGLTLKMIFASIIGVGIVLMMTFLVMTIFQTLQAVSGDNREPVLRILPLTIDSEFSVPPGVTVLSTGSLIVAAGLTIKSPINIDFQVKIWSIETGTFGHSKYRKGIWNMLFVDENRLLVALNSGWLELWSRTNDRGSIEMCEIGQLGPTDDLDWGGIGKLCLWENENIVIGGTIYGWLMTIFVHSNSLQLLNINKYFTGAIKEFHVANKNQLCVITQNAIKILNLPCLSIVQTIQTDTHTIMGSHFVDDNLAIALSNCYLYLLNIKSISDDTITDIHNHCDTNWHTISPIHWVRLAPPSQIQHTTTSGGIIGRKLLSTWCYLSRQHNVQSMMLVSLDVAGTICIWQEGRKYAKRQIIIASPMFSNPGPISFLVSCNQSYVIFASNGYLRLFNVRLNKYERSIQILGLHPKPDINEIQLVTNKWIVCLNAGHTVFVIPISTIQ